MALNPFIADIGNLLPEFISGSALVSVVLSLPTTGPMLVRALQTQDMYLAGSFLMLRIVPGRDRRAGVRPPAGLARSAHPASAADRRDEPRRRPRRGRALRRPGPVRPPRRRADLTPEQERFYTASQWRLMWWRFRRHRLAVVSAVFLLLCYGSIADHRVDRPLRSAHPRPASHLRPAAVGSTSSTRGGSSAPLSTARAIKLDMDTLKRIYAPDPARVEPLRFFCRGDRYLFWGRWPADFHLVCPAEGGTLVPARHRPARAGHVLPHPLRGPGLAHRRPDRHHASASCSASRWAASPATMAAGPTC